MIVDINAFFGKWPYWPVHVSEAGEVVRELGRWGIDRAVVCSTRSIFVSWEDGNCEAEQAVRAFPSVLAAFACLGTRELSHAPARGGYDFNDYAARGFRGLRLYPQHHSYALLAEPFVDDVCEQAVARGWPVLLPRRVIMNWGMPVLDLAAIAALVERHPRVHWILAGINYLEEQRAATALMRRFATVYLETSCLMGFDAVAKLVAECGADRILFGSGAPLQHGHANVQKVMHARIPDVALEAIISGNARRLLRLESWTQ